VTAAAQAIGITRAAPIRPLLPPECREHVGRVIPKLGEKPRWTLKHSARTDCKFGTASAAHCNSYVLLCIVVTCHRLNKP